MHPSATFVLFSIARRKTRNKEETRTFFLQNPYEESHGEKGIFRIIQSVLSPKTELTNTKNPKGLEENREVAREGGSIAGDARKSIEEKTGQPVITSKNAIDFGKLIGDVAKEIDRYKIK